MELIYISGKGNGGGGRVVKVSLVHHHWVVDSKNNFRAVAWYELLSGYYVSYPLPQLGTYFNVPSCLKKSDFQQSRRIFIVKVLINTPL